MATLAERFEALVDRGGDHHLWLGATDQHGVPQLRVNGRLTTARRVAWQLDRGALPDGGRIQACAREPTCVRVEHLALKPVRSRAPRVRRPRGDGSLREIRPGVWRLTLTVEPGLRISRTIRSDRNDADRELARLEARHGHRPETVDTLVAAHHAHLAGERSPSTIRRYEQLWRSWLAPSLGDGATAELQQRDVEVALTAMADAGQSNRSIHQAAVVLNTAYAWAHDQGWTTHNPIVGCELPNGDTLTAARRR